MPFSAEKAIRGTAFRPFIPSLPKASFLTSSPEISEGISGLPLQSNRRLTARTASPQADTTQTATAQDGQQQSSDEGFRLPDDIVNALNRADTISSAHMCPLPHWHNDGGDSYDIGQLTYNFYAETDYSEPPASITGNVSILFPEGHITRVWS